MLIHDQCHRDQTPRILHSLKVYQLLWLFCALFLFSSCASSTPKKSSPRISRTTAMLFSSVSLGDSDKVESLIEQGADVNGRVEGGYTPLIIAAREGHGPIVRLLIDKGADVNAKEDNGVTALMTAAAKKRHDIAKILVDAGADVNASNKKGLTALMFATTAGDTESVKMLLAQGANADARTTSGYTALMIAQELKFSEITRLLKDRTTEGTEFKEKNKDILLVTKGSEFKILIP